MDLIRSSLYAGPFLWRDLVPDTVLQALDALGTLFAQCTKQELCWSESLALGDLAR